MGLYFEEFMLNRPVTTRGRTVTEADMSLSRGFRATGIPCIDEEFSKTAGCGGRIAHGPMGMSMAIGLMAQQNLIDGTALGSLVWSGNSKVRCA